MSNKKESYKIKIAFIGNMNNMLFSMMRYFIDLEVDATLLIFSSEPDHFAPEADSWYAERYRTNIRKLPFGSPFNGFFRPSSYYKQFLKGYDIYIGCGYAPYYLSKIGLKLHLFIPYGSDIYQLPFQHYKFNYFNIKSQILYFLNIKVSYMQRKGIKNALLINHNNIMPISVTTNLKLNIAPMDIGIPMVYKENAPDDVRSLLSIELKKKIDVVKQFRYVIASQARQYWQKTIDSGSIDTLKRNDILISGFANFVTCEQIDDAVLVLFEYGPDVQASKDLIARLGIEKYVVWIDKVPRKEILFLLRKYVDLGVEQLISGYFGGTGYEILSQGVPLMTTLFDSPQEYERKTNKPFPPIINVYSQDEVKEKLSYYYHHKNELKDIGHESLHWFDSFFGMDLARKYLQLIGQLHKEK